MWRTREDITLYFQRSVASFLPTPCCWPAFLEYLASQKVTLKMTCFLMSWARHVLSAIGMSLTRTRYFDLWCNESSSTLRLPVSWDSNIKSNISVKQYSFSVMEKLRKEINFHHGLPKVKNPPLWLTGKENWRHFHNLPSLVFLHYIRWDLNSPDSESKNIST